MSASPVGGARVPPEGTREAEGALGIADVSPGERRLHAIDIRLVASPLVRPYRLAFGDLHRFETLLVEVVDEEGRRGFGEATLLPGYGGETPDAAWQRARGLLQSHAGGSTTALRTTLDALCRDAPFTATAFGTALDMLEAHPVLDSAEPLRVPLLALLNADEDLEAEFESLLEQGYRTVKLKVGLRGDDDLRRIERVQRVVAGRARIRIDANQAFDGATAARLLGALDRAGIELFEQPCDADDWEGHAQAARASRVPLMLDESIYGLDDIDRAAARAACAFLKVKLVKFGSLSRLVQAIERIRTLGMQPVLGNGVACDVGCWMEACVAARHIDNAGEMNGLGKTREPLLSNPPRIERGVLHVEAHYRPVLDRAALARRTLASERAARTTVAAR